MPAVIPAALILVSAVMIVLVFRRPGETIAGVRVVTLTQRRDICLWVAVMHLGVALLVFSFGVTSGPLGAVVVTVFSTAIFVVGGLSFLVLRYRLRQ